MGHLCCRHRHGVQGTRGRWEGGLLLAVCPPRRHALRLLPGAEGRRRFHRDGGAQPPPRGGPPLRLEGQLGVRGEHGDGRLLQRLPGQSVLAVLRQAGQPVHHHLPLRRVGEVQPGAAGHGRDGGELHADLAFCGPEDTGEIYRERKIPVKFV